jgi:SRSO17 transposase
MSSLTPLQVQQWADEVQSVAQRIGPLFARSEPRQRAVGYLKGLLSDTPRKNGWQLAEYLGDLTPDGVQHLLARADWDAEALQAELIRYVQENLYTPEGVLIVDETGFLKKGTKSCGVARQYSGTAGKIENCQIGVFLAYATTQGPTLIDRSLYLPKEWTEDCNRCEEASVPAKVEFATKPQLVQQMLQRVWRLGLQAKWVVADTVYGHDGKFRRFLEHQKQPSVLAVPVNQVLWDGQQRSTVGEIAETFSVGKWKRASAGEGTKGPRFYRWAVESFGGVDERGWQLWLLVRQSCERAEERAYYLCRGPAETSWRELVRVVGLRWCIEEGFELAKGDCGLDEYEVRSWIGWHRHITLSLWALAIVTVIRSRVANQPRGKKRVLD